MGERPRRVVDLDADLVRRLDPEVLGQSGVSLLQRLQRVRREQRVLSRPGAKREMSALEDLVPLGLLRRRLGQSGIAFQRALVQPTLGGLGIRFRRFVVLPLLEEDAPAEIGGLRRIRPRLHELVEGLARAGDVPGLELRLDAFGEKAQRRTERQREQQRDHFTSSS